MMSANKNILKPGSGDVVVASKLLDIVLGCYWMTKSVSGLKGEGNAFPSTNAAITAHDFDAIDLRAKIKVLPVAHLLGEAIKRTHDEESVSSLFV